MKPRTKKIIGWTVAGSLAAFGGYTILVARAREQRKREIEAALSELLEALKKTPDCPQKAVVLNDWISRHADVLNTLGAAFRPTSTQEVIRSMNSSRKSSEDDLFWSYARPLYITAQGCIETNQTFAVAWRRFLQEFMKNMTEESKEFLAFLSPRPSAQ